MTQDLSHAVCTGAGGPSGGDETHGKGDASVAGCSPSGSGVFQRVAQ